MSAWKTIIIVIIKITNKKNYSFAKYFFVLRFFCCCWETNVVSGVTLNFNRSRRSHCPISIDLLKVSFVKNCSKWINYKAVLQNFANVQNIFKKEKIIICPRDEEDDTTSSLLQRGRTSFCHKSLGRLIIGFNNL